MTENKIELIYIKTVSWNISNESIQEGIRREKMP